MKSTDLDLAFNLPHAGVMQKRSSNPGNKTAKRGQGPPDPNVHAFNIVQQATGQMPKVDPNEGKNPAAVTLGRLGGLKGGKARAASLSPRKRSQIAKKAATVRWLKHKSQPEGE